MKLPENIKHFIWLIMHNSLPSNMLRRIHHMTVDPSCHLCGAPSEPTIHALRDCNQAKRIWSVLGFSNHSDFTIVDVCDWFKALATNDHGQLFVISCWFIWRGRNEAFFSDNQWSDWQILSKINALHAAVMKSFGSATNKNQPQLVSWIAPGEDSVKLNVDGSSFGNPGRSGFGGLIRNDRGEWLAGFCGISTNLHAELLAIVFGLNLAWNSGYRKVVCESDSKTTLDIIIGGVQQTHPYAPAVNHIRRLRDYDWDLSFNHTLREGNACVDWLAKEGANSNQHFKTWSACPPQPSSSMLADFTS